ncbi:MAG: hypothetical protein ABJB05_05285 [Parafilimonas sp.]
MKKDFAIAITQLEMQIQNLQNDYKLLLKHTEVAADICTLIMHIKQAEESLRLKRRIYNAVAN